MSSPDGGAAVPFEKWHGAGNDFLIVGAGAPVEDRAAFAIRACDRGDGVGADGVLFLDLDPDADPARVGMALYQPDGSTAAMCGNGARCAAKWAAGRTGAGVVIVETPAGDRRARVDGEEVTVGMGAYSFDPGDVPLARGEPLIDEPVVPGAATDESAEGPRVTAVNTGVPHAVAFVDDVDALDLDAVAPPIRHAEVFPEGANVTVADRRGEGFRQRTFERGVEGETVACGTGAVAICAVARRRGLIDAGETVTVSPPGGDLAVTVDADGTATLRGPVVREFDGGIGVSGA